MSGRAEWGEGCAPGVVWNKAERQQCGGKEGGWGDGGVYRGAHKLYTHTHTRTQRHAHTYIRTHSMGRGWGEGETHASFSRTHAHIRTHAHGEERERGRLYMGVGRESGAHASQYEVGVHII